MESLAATQYGHYRDCLKWCSDQKPSVCNDGQVLIKVQYAELNPVDLQKLQPNKAGQDVPPSNCNGSLVVGYGGSGIIVDTKSQEYTIGQSVVFLADSRRPGAYATHIVVDQECVAAIQQQQQDGTTTISLREAATMPLAGCTAYEALEKLQLSSAENLLIVGGSGGVGSWATLLARAKYPNLVDIICTSSSKDWCTRNGASRVISHDEIKSTLKGGREGSVDRILCLTEPKPDLWSTLSEVIRPYGHICLVVAGHSVGSLDLGFLFFKAATVTTETVFSSQRTNYKYIKPSDQMKEMLELVANGSIKVPLSPQMSTLSEDWRLALDEGGLLDQLASGHTQGKLIMKVQ
eukprot:CAMPEP_0118673600 /NCGR_PEP_ID=MMETSP0800-20121206/419_1 /TAXON_ID=210618 ORGANISM="Striatella unipunctata, Strain CCMP2910" /NCGR_SAMPLE_ID=MMETSP0800 /ASSEMBLY_ACC=CAM_ASM_000638 /LENGTH=348 /DNA_ID=CAMNT_0006568695 /DNA_START=892 /DNA_END=1938 /DNA_ORIENTATION=+